MGALPAAVGYSEAGGGGGQNQQVGSVTGLWIAAKGSQPGQRMSAKSAQPALVMARRSMLALQVYLCSLSLPVPES